MEIETNAEIFDKEFDTYISRFDTLKELTEGEISQSIRLFDIRFRLALSIQISFDHTISYTKTESTRKTYKLILALNDLWFAYEGLYKVCSEKGFSKSNPTKSDPFTSEKVTDLSLDSRVVEFGAYLKNTVCQNDRSKEDAIGYLSYLGKHSFKKVQGHLNRFENNVRKEKAPEFNQIMSLIYGMRNMYVHNTDTAKSGVRQYKTKIELLKNCTDFLILSILKIAIHALDDEIKKIY
jgi:hypothetical protein